MILSLEDRFIIKNQKICSVCKGEFYEGKGSKEKGGKRKVLDHDHLWQEISSGGSNLRRVTHQSHNINISQQYFMPVFKQNSNYDLKFILPTLTHMQKGGVVDDA
jgi:hypothetical protein